MAQELGPPSFGGYFKATAYAFGCAGGGPEGLTVHNVPTAAGVKTLAVGIGYCTLIGGNEFYPLATNAPVSVGADSNVETVTPSAVSASLPGYGAMNFTANFANAHGEGDPISSATFGLQEAINAANAAGGGIVLVSAGWTKLGGTSAILAAATQVAGVTIQDNRRGVGTATQLALTTNGAIDPHTSANYVITKAGVLADTLAAPTATTDDGVIITITSNTAFAHTLTATGLLNTGSAAVNLATFAAFAGAGLTLRAYQAKWNVLSSTGITFT